MGILLTEGADTAATASSMGLIGSILIMVLMYAVLWFFIMEFGNNKNCRIPMEKTAISRVEKPGEA